MINTTIKYIVYTHTGSGVRHHHFGTQNNIINQANGHAVADDVINALGFASLPFNGNNLPFAFMSVHGAADGNHLYTSPGNQTVKVGNNHIDILVVYAPVGGFGGSGGGPGVWLDAFNVDTGNFSDSDFIQVLTPPTPPDTLDNPKTAHANMEGDVSTATAENLRAFANVDGAPFSEWKKIIPVEAYAASRELNLSKNESGEIWFAFYQSLPPEQVIPRDTARAVQAIRKLREVIIQFVVKWVEDEWCGTHPRPFPRPIGPTFPPVGPGGPHFQLSIKADIIKSLRPAQLDKLQSYMKEYPALAKAAYDQMAQVTAMLDRVSQILSEEKRK